MNQGSSDTSVSGSVLMLVTGLAVAYVGVQYFQLEYLIAGIFASAAAILAGFFWNLIASVRGGKKVHWLDFVFSLLPWW